MKWCTILGAPLGAAIAGLALSTSAWAAPGADVTLGPVVVPEGPLQVCVGERCEPTPPVTSVAMTLSATAPGVGTEPRVTAVRCPTGTGVAAQVTAGPGGETVSGTLTIVSGGATVALPLRQTLAPGAPPLLITACTVR